MGWRRERKVVDVLTPRYDVIARFQGGPNAGHTLEFEGKKYVLRSIPSGIFQHGQVNIIGNGVVLDPVLFKEEAEALEKSGIALKEILKISKKTSLTKDKVLTYNLLFYFLPLLKNLLKQVLLLEKTLLQEDEYPVHNLPLSS